MCDSFFVFFRMHGRWSPFLTRQRTQREISWYFHIYDWFIDQLGGKGVVKDFTPYQNYLPKGERERESILGNHEDELPCKQNVYARTIS